MSRGLKQFTYGAGFLLFFSAVIFGMYALLIKPAPTCTDKRQNQEEIGVDCGGPCAPCEQKYAQDIEVESFSKFSAGENKTVIAAYIKNPNDDYGVRDVLYIFDAKDDEGKVLQSIKGRTFMHDRRAKSGRYLLVTFDVAMENIDDVSLTFSEADVVPAEEFIEPNVVVKQFSTDIIGLKKTLVPIYVFTKDIGIKATGEDVVQLETFLVKKGFFKKSPDMVFDLDTKIALTAYQKSKKIAQANGILGLTTRTIINAEVDKVTKVVVEENGSVTVNGNIKNNSVVESSKVIITCLLSDSMGVQLGASKTELENVEAAQDRAFKIIFPKSVPIQLIDATRTQIFVDSF